MDDVMAWTASLVLPSFSVQITANIKNLMKVGTSCLVYAWVDEKQDRKIWVKGR